MGETESTRYAWVRDLDPASKDVEVKLVAFLGDPSWRVRQEAVNAVKRYGVTQSLVERLIEAMGSGHSAGLRNASSEALVVLGEPVVEPLLSSLASADSSQRKFIVDALGLVGSQASKAGLFAAINDRDDNVAAAAVEALGRIGGEDVLRELSRIVREVEGQLQLKGYLLDTLGKCEAELNFEFLLNSASQVAHVRWVGPLLGFVNDDRIIQTLADLAKNPSRSTRNGAIKGFHNSLRRGHLDDQTVLDAIRKDDELLERLRQGLFDKEQEAAEASLAVLSRCQLPEFVPDILNAVAGKPWEKTILQGCLSLGRQICDPLMQNLADARVEAKLLSLEVFKIFKVEDCRPLLKTFIEAGEQREAEASIEVLAEISHRNDIRYLVELLCRGDIDLRESAGLAVSMIGKSYPEETATALREFIDSGLRPDVVRALGKLALLEDRTWLTVLIKHEDVEIRRAALEAAAHYGESFPSSPLREAMKDISPQVRSAAAKALGSFSADPEIHALRTGLSDDDPWVVSSAVMALGRCGGRMAVPALIDAMEHRSSAVVIAAIQALGRMVPDSLSLVISKGLEKDDPEIVRETISLVRFLTKRDAESFLRPLLEHVHWDVRLMAAQAYRERNLQLPTEILNDLIANEPEYLVRDVFSLMLEGQE